MTIPNNKAGSSPPGADGSDGGWQATRAQTQLARDERDYLATAAEDRGVGRQVGANQYELFVSCDAGPALQQQFEHLQPQFIALHDVATRSTRKLLAGVAKASQREVQTLIIRRQSYGNTLATIEFVELPGADGSLLRIYSTEADADTLSRHAIARMLLAYSALGVVMVGELPGHSMANVFKPMHEDMLAGPWPNRHILMLPLSAANALVTQGMELSRGTGVNVRTTPQVSRPADAWNFISSTWTRLRDELRATMERQVPPPGTREAVWQATQVEARPTPAQPVRPQEPPVRAAVQPLPLRPMPAVPGAASNAAAPRDAMSRYVQQLSELTGIVSVCIFDMATGRDLMHAGASPGPVELAEHGSELMSALMSTSRTLGLGHAIPEAAITLGAHHLVLRAVPKNPGLALHAVLDKTHANLTLARLQIMRMDAVFDEPGI